VIGKARLQEEIQIDAAALTSTEKIVVKELPEIDLQLVAPHNGEYEAYLPGFVEYSMFPTFLDFLSLEEGYSFVKLENVEIPKNCYSLNNKAYGVGASANLLEFLSVLGGETTVSESW
jgi:hypothetical protein